MKTNLHEIDHGYFIEFVAETIEDAALLCRMAINSTKELGSVDTYAEGKDVSTQVVIGRRKNSTAKIPRP